MYCTEWCTQPGSAAGLPIMLPSMWAHSLQDRTASPAGFNVQVFAPWCPEHELKC